LAPGFFAVVAIADELHAGHADGTSIAAAAREDESLL
jgi:hypothetical protein